MSPIKKYQHWRKGRSTATARWIVGALTVGVVLFASLQSILRSDVALAATWGTTSITDTADDSYEAEGDSRWYASDQGE
jgi:hypothetical protein